MRLLVIDGNSIANRAFFGIKLLTTKDGRYTNAIYGFLNILLSLLKECEPDEVAVAFDLKAPTFRHKMYDGYKATRHGMPEELAQQMPVLKELLADLGYRTVTAEGWEADDILGTLAAACAARKDDCFLATGDRDSLQLVSDTTTVLLAATVMGRSKTGQKLCIKWEQPMQRIVEKYAAQTKTCDWLLPILHDNPTEQTYHCVQMRMGFYLKKVARMAGIQGNLTFYTARHSWATIAHDNHAPISVISEALGHDSERTTQIYLRSIQTAEVDKTNANILAML